MLKNLRKIILALSFVCLLMASPIASAKNEVSDLDNFVPEQMILIQKDIKVNDLDIEPIDTQGLKKSVVPDVKKEGKQVFIHFIRAMLLVAFSAIIIYLILIFIKKYSRSAFMNQEEEYFEAFDLSTPDSKQDALKTFLNRTK